jgi:hypothetical protein
MKPLGKSGVSVYHIRVWLHYLKGLAAYTVWIVKLVEGDVILVSDPSDLSLWNQRSPLVQFDLVPNRCVAMEHSLY